MIAELPTVERCYGLRAGKERCFKTISHGNNRLAWSAARDWCRNQTNGYALVTIRDDATQDALATFLTDIELTSSSVWIGARQNVRGRWRWLDGTVEPRELFTLVIFGLT